MEHRWGDRKPLILPVRIFGPGQLCAIGWLTDISVSGTYVRTLAALTTMSRIMIEVEVPNGGVGRPLQLHGRVVRQGAAGVGVEWDEFASWHRIHPAAQEDAPQEAYSGARSPPPSGAFSGPEP